MNDNPAAKPLLVEPDQRGVPQLTMNLRTVRDTFDDHQARRLIEALERTAENRRLAWANDRQEQPGPNHD